jgi:two-component system, LuxR family, response regulator FixJ
MKPKKPRLKNSGEILSGNKQIFILDDDASVCCALGVLLVTYGFKVDTFTSAEEFFRAVPNSVPGCLILDIHMPKLDGWEVLRRVIRSGPKRPVIIMSADKSSVNYERAIKAGAVGYLQKPFNDRELVGFIKDALEK